MKAIEVFADIWCPFAHVGIHCAVERRALTNHEDTSLYVRSWPLELINQAPLDPSAAAHHVHELRKQVAPDLFQGFDPKRFPTTTLPALAWVHAAYAMDMRTGEAVSIALRNALFEDGVDIGDPDLLSDIVLAEGVASVGDDDERAVIADWHEGVARGVKGSPHFFCGDADAFCPSLDIFKDEAEHLTIRSNMEVLDSFLDVCFNT